MTWFAAEVVWFGHSKASSRLHEVRLSKFTRLEQLRVIAWYIGFVQYRRRGMGTSLMQWGSKLPEACVLS